MKKFAIAAVAGLFAVSAYAGEKAATTTAPKTETMEGCTKSGGSWDAKTMKCTPATAATTTTTTPTAKK